MNLGKRYNHYQSNRFGFLFGMARIFDIGASLKRFNYDSTADTSEQDKTSLLSDWKNIGNDIQASINSLNR